MCLSVSVCVTVPCVCVCVCDCALCVRQVEKTELSQRETSQVVQMKDSLIADMEAEVRQVGRFVHR